MARTTAIAVRDVLMRDYDTVDCPKLSPFIDKASVMTDRVAACAIAKGTPYTSAELEIIERYLTAHSYAMSDRTYSQRSTLRASGTFDGKTGMYLEATFYGQQAKEVDALGCLESLGKTKQVSAFWLGKPPSNQIDYQDRD